MTTLVLTAMLLAADSPLVVENDLVRILKVVSKAGVKSRPHVHPTNRVMVYLDKGQIDIQYEDGKKEEGKWSAEDVAWSPTGPVHTSHNVGGTDVRVVEIELKQPAPAAAEVRDAKLDPVKLDPKHNRLLFENAQVRVMRTWLEPGKSEKWHEHTGRGRVVVLLTPIHAKVKLVDGTESEMSLDAGEVRWTKGQGQHAGTNIGKGRFAMILVEVK
jgi:quercetin dioxygenase-like cupin family protein